MGILELCGELTEDAEGDDGMFRLLDALTRCRFSCDFERRMVV